LRSYTFSVDVAMAMHHFPWLHFHMRGVGDYERGTRYVVHFTHMPWFAPHQNDIDLSMIDPQMWPQNYTEEVAGTRDGDTIYELHALKDANLARAQVAISPVNGTEWVDASYTDGTQIRMNVTSQPTDGFLLPSHISAEIGYPHMPLSANADFTDYAIGTDAAQ